MMPHMYPARSVPHLLGNGGVTIRTNRQREVVVRQGAVADTNILLDMHQRLSDRTIRLRYGAPKHAFSDAMIEAQMARMLSIDPQLAATLIGTVEESGASHAVSVVQLVQSPADPTTAEIAIMVRDDYQGEGLGRALTRLIPQLARARGVRTLRIDTLAENVAVMRLLRGMGAPYTASTRRGETTVVMRLGEPLGSGG
jgi:GNAT superfamily N-acetyltransferase